RGLLRFGFESSGSLGSRSRMGLQPLSRTRRTALASLIALSGPEQPSPGSGGMALFLNQVYELSQFAFVEVGDGPVGHAGLRPLQEVIALACHHSGRCFGARCRGPDEEIDGMLAALVNQGRYRPVVEVVEAPADQGET